MGLDVYKIWMWCIISTKLLQHLSSGYMPSRLHDPLLSLYCPNLFISHFLHIPRPSSSNAPSIQPPIKTSLISKPRKPRFLFPLLFSFSFSAFQILLAPDSSFCHSLAWRLTKHAISCFCQYTHCKARCKVECLRETVGGE